MSHTSLSEEDVPCTPTEGALNSPALCDPNVRPPFEMPVSAPPDTLSDAEYADLKTEPAKVAETTVKPTLKNMHWIALLLILASCGLSALWGTALMHSVSGGMTDFKALYSGARCLIQHADPYKESEFLRVFQADGGTIPADPMAASLFRRAVLVCVNMPSALFLMLPFAHLPLGVAYTLWMLLMAAGLGLAAFLMWTVGARKAPRISLFLLCVLLANCVILFKDGNAAGIVVGLCAVAAWCFLEDRFVPAGIVCLALSLAFKPHDAGLVWLYFLLAGGTLRKRALQTLLVTAALCVPAFLWVSHVAPNWLPEMQSNLHQAAAHGGLNDPGPSSISFHHPDPIIDLQAFISVFRDNPRFYVPAAYLVSGSLVLLWAITTMRARFSRRNAWFALAAIAALTMLISYHRQHDAKLLLLTVPACAMLWAEGGLIRWSALAANTAGIIVTGDIPATTLSLLTGHMAVGAGIVGHMKTALMVRPAPLFLLVIAIFYVWVYVRRAAPRSEAATDTEHSRSLPVRLLDRLQQVPQLSWMLNTFTPLAMRPANAPTTPAKQGSAKVVWANQPLTSNNRGCLKSNHKP
ncbi:MAG: glycosyltransferase family 87 protein [Terracidiphilus sp.]